MKIAIIIAILAGLAGAVGVVAYLGWGAVMAAALSVGWAGYGFLCVYALGVVTLLGAAWRLVLPREPHAHLAALAGARLVRDAAGELLPFTSLGGFMAGARAAMLSGLSGPTAFASSLVDCTTEVFAQAAFILLGGGLWAVRETTSAASPTISVALSVGVALVIGAALALFAVQKRAIALSVKAAEHWLPAALQNTRDFESRVGDIYADQRAIALSSAMHLMAWIASSVGVWITFKLIHTPLDLAAVISIEALICALRSVAFFVPSALGVQEVGYAFIAPLFGLPPEAGLAVSLLKRAREILTGVIALAIWQALEANRLIPRTAGQDGADHP